MMHRDIKLKNVVMFKDGTIKIIDLENHKDLKNTIGNKSKTEVGTIGHMAPELKNSKPYDKPADIWSFGVLVVQLYLKLGNMRFINDIREKIKDIKDKEIQNLCEKCLKEKESERISINDLLIEIDSLILNEIIVNLSVYENLTFENDQMIKKFCNNNEIVEFMKEEFALFHVFHILEENLFFRCILNGDHFENERKIFLNSEELNNNLCDFVRVYYLQFKNYQESVKIFKNSPISSELMNSYLGDANQKNSTAQRIFVTKME